MNGLYVALLRGINVGRHKRVSMSELRALLVGLGYSDVATVLQSGNAVFVAGDIPAPAVERRIEEAIHAALGLEVRCVVRTAAELGAVIAGNPLTAVATDGSKLLALFLSEAPPPAMLAGHDPAELGRDHIVFGDRVIYQWCPDGVLAAPPVSGYVEKHLGVVVTARNWNTVTKLGALLDG